MKKWTVNDWILFVVVLCNIAAYVWVFEPKRYDHYATATLFLFFWPIVFEVRRSKIDSIRVLRLFLEITTKKKAPPQCKDPDCPYKL